MTMELKFCMSSKTLSHRAFTHSTLLTSAKILHFPKVRVCLRLGSSGIPRESAPQALDIHKCIFFNARNSAHTKPWRWTNSSEHGNNLHSCEWMEHNAKWKKKDTYTLFFIEVKESLLTLSQWSINLIMPLKMMFYVVILNGEDKNSWLEIS